MFVVDTNVLVYAADAHAPEHTRCRAILDRWRRRSGAWYLTWGICYEFLRVVTHTRVFRHPCSRINTAVSASCNTLPASRGTSSITSARTRLWRSVGISMLRPGDCCKAVRKRKAASAVHGIRRICTRDTDFHRFSFLEPIDPLTAEP